MPPLNGRPRGRHLEAAGWVLGVLDRGDADGFAGHLLSCGRCQSAVTELEPLARLLKNTPTGLNEAGPKPPADLASRTLRRVEWAARLASAAPAGEPPPNPAVLGAGDNGGADPARAQPPAGPDGKRDDQAGGPIRWHTIFARAAARPRMKLGILSLGAAAAVAAAAVSISLWAAQPSPPAVALTIPLHAPRGGTAAGVADIHRAQGGWSIHLVVHGLEGLPAGSFYECWYARPGRPGLIAAGTFTVNGAGSAAVQMWSAADPRRFPDMQISMGRAGDPGQRGALILAGSLQHGPG
jgi:hypothetical protein